MAAIKVGSTEATLEGPIPADKSARDCEAFMVGGCRNPARWRWIRKAGRYTIVSMLCDDHSREMKNGQP